MDFKNAYAWGNLFASPWADLVSGMNVRATAMGLSQEVVGQEIFWLSRGTPKAKFCFVEDPSDIDAIRRIFNDEGNVSQPACYIVVRQHDPFEERGDIIFDIFRMSPESYLWHFNRVYTPPE
jgi:hypothetical protein